MVTVLELSFWFSSLLLDLVLDPLLRRLAHRLCHRHELSCVHPSMIDTSVNGLLWRGHDGLGISGRQRKWIWRSGELLELLLGRSGISLIEREEVPSQLLVRERCLQRGLLFLITVRPLPPIQTSFAVSRSTR